MRFLRQTSRLEFVRWAGFTVRGSNLAVSLPWLFNIRDATPESLIYDSTPVQQRYPAAFSVSVDVSRRSKNIESSFHSRYEFKK
jgi:hypothetical protein